MSPPPGRKSAVADRLGRAFTRAATAGDRVDRRHVQRSPTALTPGHPGAVPAAWATARLVGAGVILPVLGAIVGSAALRNTRQTIRLIAHYPRVIDAALTGAPIDYPARRVERVPAAGRYFISSDLHRCIPGTVDWPGHQNVAPLYEVALDFYAADDWGLVENGDVEDFWLAGGSTYGVVYDVFRLAGHALRGRTGEALLRTIYREHLRRIVAHNRGVYDRIEDGFHATGRYRRLVGNHDDVFLDEEMVDALGDVHPGVTVADFVVFELDDDAHGPGVGTGVGIATHGHHVDSWNAPFKSGLGKLGTWFGSTLLDAPFAANPGMPDVEETDILLAGKLPDLLTKVSRYLGANRDLYSVDETLLFESFRRHAGVPRGSDIDAGTWLILGHTHLPLRRPLDPDTRASWDRYINSGSGIFFECLTGIEWDGSRDAADPEVRLVAWRFADRDDDISEHDVVGWAGDRAVVREVLDRVPPSENLSVVATGVPALHGRPS